MTLSLVLGACIAVRMSTSTPPHTSIVKMCLPLSRFCRLHQPPQPLLIFPLQTAIFLWKVNGVTEEPSKNPHACCPKSCAEQLAEPGPMVDKIPCRHCKLETSDPEEQDDDDGGAAVGDKLTDKMDLLLELEQNDGDQEMIFVERNPPGGIGVRLGGG